MRMEGVFDGKAGGEGGLSSSRRFVTDGIRKRDVQKRHPGNGRLRAARPMEGSSFAAG